MATVRETNVLQIIPLISVAVQTYRSDPASTPSCTSQSSRLVPLQNQGKRHGFLSLTLARKTIHADLHLQIVLAKAALRPSGALSIGGLQSRPSGSMEHYQYGSEPELSENSHHNPLDNQLDEVRIKQEIQAAMDDIITSGGVCQYCDHILRIVSTECESIGSTYHKLRDGQQFRGVRFHNSKGPEAVRGVRFHNSKGLEAASRAGCRMCSYIMHAMEESGDLRALRSIEQSLRLKEQRLWALGAPGAVGHYGPRGTIADHMTVDISLGMRTNVSMQIRRPGGYQTDESRPDPLLSLAVWGKSKDRKLCLKDVVGF